MKIEQTYKYDIFIFDEGNQKRINQAHLKVLINSIRLKDFTHVKPINVKPVIIDGVTFYVIIDGQHRYLACKELGKPIYYIPDPNMGIEDIPQVHIAQKSHTMDELLAFHVIHGHKDYKVYDMFRRRYKFSHSICLMLLSDKPWRNTTDFKVGLFRIGSLASASEIANQLQDFSFPSFKAWNCRGFVLAFLEVSTHPEYNHGRMMNKVQLQPRSLVKCPNWQSYVLMLEDIYNHYASDKIRFSS